MRPLSRPLPGSLMPAVDASFADYQPPVQARGVVAAKDPGQQLEAFGLAGARRRVARHIDR